jgi:hypothetical protein
MKKSELKQIIREEIEKLSSQEYTVKDLYQMILDGETITVSPDGGHSSSTYALERDYGVNPIENFESFVIEGPRYKNKTFVQKKPGMFIVKGTEGTIDAISRFYDTDKRFKGD